MIGVLQAIFYMAILILLLPIVFIADITTFKYQGALPNTRNAIIGIWKCLRAVIVGDVK